MEAINLTATSLAALAGIHHTAVTRAIAGGNCGVVTLQAISRALTEKERVMQAHLNALHPGSACAGKGEEG